MPVYNPPVIYANPSATGGPAAVNGAAAKAMRADAAPAIQTATTLQQGLVQPDGTTVTIAAGVISSTGGASFANPTATAGPNAVNGVLTTAMRSDAAPKIQTATAGQLGLVQPDGSTILVNASGVISTANGSGVLFSTAAFVGNGADTTEDTLQTFTMAAGQMGTNGNVIRITGRAQITNTNATKTFRVYFGATVVALLQLTGTNTGFIYFDITVARQSGTVQICNARITYSAANGSITGATLFINQASGAETLSGAVTVKCTGQSTVGTANTVFCDTFFIEFLA